MPSDEFCRAGFRLWNIQVIDARAPIGTRQGQVTWVSAKQPDIGLAWDWVEVVPGVVALEDPLQIVCNVEVTDAASRKLDADGRRLMLNRVVHRLPWQRAVRDKLASPVAQKRRELQAA
jgi:hypothetical protein